MSPMIAPYLRSSPHLVPLSPLLFSHLQSRITPPIPTTSTHHFPYFTPTFCLPKHSLKHITSWNPHEHSTLLLNLQKKSTRGRGVEELWAPTKRLEFLDSKRRPTIQKNQKRRTQKKIPQAKDNFQGFFLLLIFGFWGSMRIFYPKFWGKNIEG